MTHSLVTELTNVGGGGWRLEVELSYCHLIMSFVFTPFYALLTLISFLGKKKHMVPRAKLQHKEATCGSQLFQNHQNLVSGTELSFFSWSNTIF